MVSASDHGRVILSAIIPSRRDLLERSLRALKPSHFTDQIQSTIFSLLNRYYEVTGDVLTEKALEGLLERSSADAGRILLYTETFAVLASDSVTDADFAWSLREIQEIALEKATEKIIAEGMEVLKKGLENESGELLKGHEEARDRILANFADLERDYSAQESPEGDMKSQRNEILNDYATRKADRLAGKSQGINFGISELDSRLGGLQNGELVLSAAYSSDGKTSLCVQLAWHAAVMQGKNVVFLTTETVHTTVKRKIIARHSKHPKFGLPDGLNTRDLKAGTLSDLQEAKLQEVVDDFTNNPTHGTVYIVQVPERTTIAWISNKLHAIQRMFHIDIAICDYLALLSSNSRRQTSREELAAILKDAKSMCTTFDSGRGLAFVSPWQVNRKSREDAATTNQYSSESLAETAEATNSADVIISLLAPMDNTSRHALLHGQILKNRDGETVNNLLIDVDYATSAFRSRQGASAFNENSLPSQASAFAGLLEGQ